MTAFKIYLPAAPRQDVNHGELPWVYDQDPASGNVASMWVMPVKNLPPERPWVGLTDDELLKTYGWQFESYGQSDRPSSLGQSIVDEAKQEIIDGLRKVEAALKEKNNAK